MSITKSSLFLLFALMTLFLSFGSGNANNPDISYDDRCTGGRCSDGTILANEQSWTNSTCGPEAMINATRLMCGSVPSRAFSLRVNRIAIGTLKLDLGIGVRQLTDDMNENFSKLDDRCPNGNWHWSKPSRSEYIEFLQKATEGKKVALVITHGKTKYPHWIVVEKIFNLENSCFARVRNGGGVGQINCKRLVQIADGVSSLIPTPARGVIYFQKRIVVRLNDALTELCRARTTASHYMDFFTCMETHIVP